MQRARHAVAIHYSLVESCKENKINSPTYLPYTLSNARNKAVVLPASDEFANHSPPQSAGALFDHLE